MRKTYSRPSIKRFGRLEQITLLGSGNLLEIDAQTLQPIGNQCQGTTPNQVLCGYNS